MGPFLCHQFLRKYVCPSAWVFHFRIWFSLDSLYALKPAFFKAMVYEVSFEEHDVQVNSFPKELPDVDWFFPDVIGQKEYALWPKDPKYFMECSLDLVFGKVNNRIEGNNARNRLVFEVEVEHVRLSEWYLGMKSACLLY